MRTINRIIIHCAATRNGVSIASGSPGKPGYRPAVATIDGWHKDAGFRRSAPAVNEFNPTLRYIGYHFVIDIDGKTETGRSIAEVGAHVANFNSDSIGICLVGTDRFTRAQWDALRKTVCELAMRYNVPLAFANVAANSKARGLLGHRDCSPDTNHNGRVDRHEWIKVCPGFNVEAWVANDLQPVAEALL